jgi:lactate racemase
VKVHLKYGVDGLDVDIPGKDVRVLEPTYPPPIDEPKAFAEAVRNPIKSEPLAKLIKSTDKVAIVIPDITRPLPTERLLKLLFGELSHVPADCFVIINGTGSHRPNTPEELIKMVGADIFKRYRVVNHDAQNPSAMLVAGHWPDGQPILMAKDYVRADKRIALGFIEPHFIAGFSGGYKAVFPGIADIKSIMRYHDAPTVGHLGSTWGTLEGNPTQAAVRQCGSVLPLHFLINITQDQERRMTGIFCGDVMAAHAQGCSFAKSSVMVAVDRRFPIVVTTNGGYPLDQNLYQAVKGMHAAALIVKPGGLIVIASKCNDGFPEHGNFKRLLFDHASPEAILKTIEAPGFSMYDQWEAQLLAMVAVKARIALYSDIPAEEVTRAHLESISNISMCIRKEMHAVGECPIAVLPEGPLTIPYLS